VSCEPQAESGCFDVQPDRRQGREAPGIRTGRPGSRKGLVGQLDERAIRAILGPMLEEVRASLKEQYGVALEFDKAAVDFIAREGFSPTLGARELRRTVERLVQTPLSALALSGKLKEHSSWQAVCGTSGLSFTPRAVNSRDRE